jgi:iron complex outermembrane receptor protein
VKARIRILPLTFAIAAPLVWQPLHAQTAASGGLEEIVVTAQRRAEVLQSVPIAITVLQSDDLAAAGVTNVQELSSLTPGLQMTQQRNLATPYLRGVGTQNGGQGEESSIALYVDGVYYAAQSAGIFSLADVERVEVLKGPQGTLFGRNATGGLIHVITRTPQQEPMVQASASYAKFDTLSGSLYATTGITDTLAIDLSLFTIDQGEGWGENLVLGNDVNLVDETIARTKILWTPTDSTTLTIAADWSENKTDIGNTRQLLPGAIGIGGAVFQGSVWDAQSDIPRDVDGEQKGVSVRFEHDFGSVRFVSLSAYREIDNFTLFDQDNTAAPLIIAPITEFTSTFQQEFLLQGEVGKLQYTGGLFYFDADASVEPLGLRSAVLLQQNLDRYSEQKTKSYAAFAQATYAFTDRTSVTAGLRYTLDEREIIGRDVSAAGHPQGPGIVLSAMTQDDDFTKMTWRFALDHELREDVLLYGSISRGFKSGIYNTTNFLQPAVEPETLDAGEIGIKADLLNRHLRINASAFYYDYADIQLTARPAGITLLFNAAEGTVKGMELEATALVPVPTGRLELSASGSLLDSEYDEFEGALFSIPQPTGGNALVVGDASGNDMIRAPKWTTNLTARYSIPVGAFELATDVSWYHNDGFYWEPDNRLRQKAYDVLNAQLAISTADETWRVRVFGRNLLNEKYYVSASANAFGDAGAAASPRTYGVAIDYRWQP